MMQRQGSGDALNTVSAPDIPPQILPGGVAEGSVQFILPRTAKTELRLFAPARDAYDKTPGAQKLLDHSLLLDQGIPAF
jgi:hypothetical protein